MKWPKIHHHNPRIQEIYQKVCQKKFFDNNFGVDRNFPKINILKNGFYAIHRFDDQVEQSAWNSNCIIENLAPKSGWVYPKKTKPDVFLEGDYIGFCSWFQGNYGHMMHDSLPYISWLRKEFENYNFLLLDNPVSKQIIQAFDLDFYKKIFWIKKDEVVSIKGNLVTTNPDMHPCIMSSNLMNYFLEWLAEKLPKPSNRKNVIYYNRSLDTNKRIINKKNNEKIIYEINKKMILKNIEGDLIIFNTAQTNPKMSIKEQLELFRNAHTIIGPHGSGLINVLWSDIFGKNPIKFLEFIPGDNGYSAQVQHEFNGYHNVLSGVPIDYHCIIYEPNSTNYETFISLDHLNMALDEIWSFNNKFLFL